MSLLKRIDAWRHRKSKELKLRRRRAEAQAIAERLGEGFCILSNNCFGGRLYQDLGLPYATPTVGLFMVMTDFIEFCANAEHYLRHGRLTFVRETKWEHLRGSKRTAGAPYPIGLLDGKIELHFLHYASEEEARSKWERRAARVDPSRIIPVGVQINGVTDADYAAFAQLPQQQKYIFTTTTHPGCTSEIILPADGADTVGDGIRHTRRFYRAWLKKMTKGL